MVTDIYIYLIQMYISCKTLPKALREDTTSLSCGRNNEEEVYNCDN